VISLNLDDKIDMPQVKGVLKIPGWDFDKNKVDTPQLVSQIKRKIDVNFSIRFQDAKVDINLKPID
jgi:hypothetical protein